MNNSGKNLTMVVIGIFIITLIISSIFLLKKDKKDIIDSNSTQSIISNDKNWDKVEGTETEKTINKMIGEKQVNEKRDIVQDQKKKVEEVVIDNKKDPKIPKELKTIEENLDFLLKQSK